MAFETLSVELNTLIAGFLDDDKDLAAFAKTCKTTWAAILSDHSPLWRLQYQKHFDVLPSLNNNLLRLTYKNRRMILRRGAVFTSGSTRDERLCLQALTDLIIESYAGRDPEHSPNLASIEKFAETSNLLRAAGRSGQPITKLSPKLKCIQIVLAHLQLDSKSMYECRGFLDCQRAVYQPARHTPLFKGVNQGTVNTGWALQALDFFKYHFIHKEGELRPEFEQLPRSLKPSAWKARIPDTVYSLGRNWKGCYSYLPPIELAQVRDGRGIYSDVYFQDIFNEHDGGFQTLRTTFPVNRKRHAWPNLFERHLRSVTHPTLKDVWKSYGGLDSPCQDSDTPSKVNNTGCIDCGEFEDLLARSFSGSGRDGHGNDDFLAAGWVTPLPEQCGIPGWMRFTMMKFFFDPRSATRTSSRNLEQYRDPLKQLSVDLLDDSTVASIEHSGLWAYEGIVLPGGQFIVGRWWSANESTIEAGPYGDNGTYSGPFILWNVDKAEDGDDLDDE